MIAIPYRHSPGFYQHPCHFVLWTRNTFFCSESLVILPKVLRSILLCLIIVCFSATAQAQASWNNKQAAVVLTYDDALNVHLDNAIPLLDSLQLPATFYLTAYSPACRNRLNEWRAAAAKGYELGNHTLYHPCEGDRPGRDFVTKDYNMKIYSVKRMVDEIRMTNTFLEAVDGLKQRTFAFTCGDTKVNDTAFIDQMRNDFVAARTVEFTIPTIKQVDLYALPCFGVNGQSGNDLIKLVKQAIEKKGLLIFLFHGVGGEHGLNVSLAAHRQLLLFLKEHQKDLWVTTALNLGQYIKKLQ